MRKLLQRISLTASMVLVAFSITAAAQERTETTEPADVKPSEVRANALRQLGLSREQLAEIRKINQARKPQMEEAQGRLRRANQALDESIYSDSISEAAFETRLKEFQAAQADVSRIRFVNELAVRRVLSADQLGRFRQIRERFDRARTARDAVMINTIKDARPLKMRRMAPR